MRFENIQDEVKKQKIWNEIVKLFVASILNIPSIFRKKRALKKTHFAKIEYFELLKNLLKIFINTMSNGTGLDPFELSKLKNFISEKLIIINIIKQ